MLPYCEDMRHSSAATDAVSQAHDLPPRGAACPPVRIRRATVRDLSALIAFHRALYVDEPLLVVPPERRAHYGFRGIDDCLEQDVRALLLDGTSIVLLAESEGTAVGYVAGTIEEVPRRVLPRVGLVTDWFVAECARGRGVGRRLMESMIRVFTALACDGVESRTYASNEAARRVHVALGFWDFEVRMRHEGRPPTEATGIGERR